MEFVHVKCGVTYVAKKMILENFRGFVELTVTFEERCTVLIGVNGSGKSSVLDAAAIALESF